MGQLRLPLGSVQDMSTRSGCIRSDERLQRCFAILLRRWTASCRKKGVELEFIVVNDGSTDKTGEILDDYARRDHRVRVIHQENTGLTRALIRGCDAARGEFIARQDAGRYLAAGPTEKTK